MIKFSKCRLKVTAKVKYFGTTGKVLSQGIHKWYMKVLPITIQKVRSRYKILKCRPKITVNVAR